VLQHIVSAAAQLADAEYGALGVLGPNGTIDRFLTYGIDEEHSRAIGHYPRGRGLLGLLIEHPAPLRVAHISTHPASYGFPAHHPAMESFLGVPVISRGEVYGNLYLTEKRGAPEFTQDDEDVIVALAAAAGAAIDNAFLLAETERRERGARATTEIVQAVLSGRATRDVLKLIADRAREISGARHAAVMLPQRGYLVVEVVSGADELGLLGAVIPETSPVAEVARTRIPLVVDALPTRVGTVTVTDHLVDSAAAYVPLVAEGRTIGVLAVLGPRPQARFPADTVTTLEAFAGQAAVALLLGQAQHDREQLAVHADRERIARDLHDLVIQRLYATGLGLAAVAPMADQPEVSTRLQETIEDLDVTIREIRSAIFQLQTPLEETDERLRQRVRRELAEAADALGFEPTATFIGPVDTGVPDRVADDLVAAVREAVSNVARHAHAHRVHVTVQVSDTDIVLVVVDDGVGLPPSGRRSGLRNLTTRAESLGGTLVAESIGPPARGTRLLWRVPRHRDE
jgi:signal transduction histidine kinase